MTDSDAGCLTGHFYRSFLKSYKDLNLKYTGLDLEFSYQRGKKDLERG